MGEITKTTVWLVEDNETYRRSVSRAIGRMDDIICGGSSGSLEQALANVGQAPPPQVMLLDINLPGINGIDGLEPIHRLMPETKVVILTVFDDHERVFHAICAGASGYLLKSSPLEKIGDAIREVMAGGAPINARIARRVLDLFSRLNAAENDYRLTAREKEILGLIVKGCTKKEIATQMSLSYHTVDSHLRSIYEKLHVNTRAGVVAKALRERLV